MKQELHINVTKSDKASNIIAEHSNLSKQQIKDAMKKGAVWLEDSKGINRLRRSSAKPEFNSILYVYYDQSILSLTPPTPTLISDEQEYSIWSKPTGMLSQGSKWSDHCTLHRWIEINQPFENNPQRSCFSIHRLDKATRGLMVIPHKKSIAASFSEIFRNRKISKSYQAIVEGKFSEQEQIIDSNIDGKNAYSSAKLIKYSTEKDQSLVEVNIKTGRKHQIRIHMNRSGHPIIGDRLHGNADENYDIDLQLASYKLSFTCPVSGEQKSYTLPDNLQISI